MKIFDLRSDSIEGIIVIATFENSILKEARVFNHENDDSKIQAINMAKVFSMDNAENEITCLILMDRDEINFEDHEHVNEDNDEIFFNGFCLAKFINDEVAEFSFQEDKYSCHSKFKELCSSSFSNFDDYEQEDIEDVLSQQFERGGGKVISFIEY